MFLRKFAVIAVPLGLMALLCLLLPLLSGWGFWAPVTQGLLLGAALSLLLPLSGAVRRREPFGGLLWVPALLTLLLLASQYLYTTGVVIPVLSLLATTDWTVITVESAFAGFTLTTCLRTA